MNHHDLLRSVSRTFALSIEHLPSALRDPVAVSYLMFRVADTLEDDPELSAPQKADMLRLWADVLAGGTPVERVVGGASALSADEPDTEVVRRAAEVLGLLEALPSPVQTVVRGHARDTAVGMARWQDHGPYVADESELDDYMFEVAGRVGYLLIDLFAWYSPRIRSRAAALRPAALQSGLALQTVNVIRGLRKDYARGWVFVPQTFYERRGLTRDSLFDPANIDRGMGVVQDLADKAERHLAASRVFVTGLPRYQHRIRLACMWPLLFAVRTLALSRDNPAVLLAEAKMGRADVKRIVRDSTLLGWSNHWVAFYFRHVARTGP